MLLIYVLAFGLAPALTSALLSLRGVNCDFATTAGNSITCESFADSWGLNLSDLQGLNPGISCPDLDTSRTYCVIGTVTNNPDPTSTAVKSSSTAVQTSATTTTLVPSPSNQPQMPGLSRDCDGFYKVSSGDGCDSIAKKHGISTAQFLGWNSEVNAQCTNLWLDYYVCVHVPGIAPTMKSTTRSTTNPAPTTAPNQPQMPGILSNCRKYHKVASGESCWTIYNATNITLKQFLSYNTYVDSNCSNLWKDYYVCIGV